MDYSEIYDTFFDPSKCSSIFYSSSSADCPVIYFLEDNGSRDFSEDDVEVDLVRIFGAGKHAVLVIKYAIPMPDDLDPTQAMACVMGHSEDVSYSFWLFFLDLKTLERFLDNFQAHYQDRSAIKYHKDDQDKSAHFFEVKKGELLTSIYYTMSALPNNFHYSP